MFDKHKLIVTLIILVVALPVAAQELGGVEESERAFRGPSYSPYANRNFPNQVLWGDTHLHTALSFDAGAFGNRLLPADAYRFAKGEELTSTTGIEVRLSRPLDWLVVSDHSDNMGLFTRIYEGHLSGVKANNDGPRLTGRVMRLRPRCSTPG